MARFFGVTSAATPPAATVVGASLVSKIGSPVFTGCTIVRPTTCAGSAKWPGARLSFRKGVVFTIPAVISVPQGMSTAATTTGCVSRACAWEPIDCLSHP